MIDPYRRKNPPAGIVTPGEKRKLAMMGALFLIVLGSFIALVA
jgi:hypothetical protein